MNDQSSPEARSSGVQSVDRAIAVLEAIAAEGSATVADLADDLDVHRSTAFRILASLEAGGLVEPDEERGRYRLGLGLVALAGSVPGQLDVARVARPVSEALAAELGETINLAVLDGHAAINIDQAYGPAAVGARSWLGKAVPLHLTSSGRVLLTGCDRSERRSLLAASIRSTIDRADTVDTVDVGDGDSPADGQVLERVAHYDAVIDEVARDGWSIVINEFEEGLNAAAAPVRDRNGAIIAALSVSGPSYRLDRKSIDDGLAALVAAADEIARQLGFHG